MSASVAAMPVQRAGYGKKARKLFRGAVGLVAVVALWQLSVPLVGLEPYFYPAPLDVWAAFTDVLRKGILLGDLSDSAGRFVGGVALGVVAGVSMGMLLGLVRPVSRAMGPLLNFLFAIVEVAWIPIFVLWWGYGLQQSSSRCVTWSSFPSCSTRCWVSAPSRKC